MKDLAPHSSEALKSFLSHVKGEGWEPSETPLNHYAKMTPEGLPCFKVDTILPFPMASIVPFFNDLEAIHRHDTQIDQCSVTADLIHIVTKSMFMVSAREYLASTTTSTFPLGYFHSFISCTHPDYKPMDDPVRGNLNGGYLLLDLGQETRLIYLLYDLDMGGSVPKKMAAKNFSSKIKGVKALIDQITNEAKEESKEPMAVST